MAMTTKPIVNLSTLRMHPDRPTNVTMPKLRIAIHKIDIKNETRKYFRLCGLLQSGMVQVNAQRNGKLSKNRIQPIKNLTPARQPPSSGYSGNSAETAGRHGQGFIFCSSSSPTSPIMASWASFPSSKGTVWVLPLSSTWTTATVGCCWWNNSDRRLYSFNTCCCATDLSLIPSMCQVLPAELPRCALRSS